MNLILAAAIISQQFPAGTADSNYTFVLTGTLAAGGTFSQTYGSANPALSQQVLLQPGAYQLTVSKKGVSSLPSDPFTVTDAVLVTLNVPDPAQKATITAA